LQLSPPAFSTQLPAASLSASSGDSEPIVHTGYDDKGFTTVYTSYPGATPMPTTEASASPLQNNAAESAVPPVPKASLGGRTMKRFWKLGDCFIFFVMLFSL
jgi:hypothetical protein